MPREMQVILFTILLVTPCVQLQNLLSGDPDKNRLTEDFITSRGFIDELHRVVTDDGYFIVLHRIIHPYKRSTKQPILFNPGPWSFSFLYLRNSPGGNVNESLNFVGPNIGFECAKRGYDVWLMDLRATLPYTYNHTSLDPDRDVEFWDFSFDDIAFFDLPKAIDYIRFNTKRRKIAMVGASLGNIEYFYLASKVPRFNQVVQPVVTMFPAISMYGTEWAKRREGLARLIVPMATKMRGSFANSFVMRYLNVILCNSVIFQDLICNPVTDLLLQIFFDFRLGSVNYERLTVYLAVLSVISNWQVAQAGSTFFNPRATMLDVDPVTNMQRYGSIYPPEYLPERITNPEQHFIYAPSDVLYGGPNYDAFKQRLGAKLRSELRIPIEFSTLSFLDGKPEDVIQWVNVPTLQILQSYD